MKRFRVKDLMIQVLPEEADVVEPICQRVISLCPRASDICLWPTQQPCLWPTTGPCKLRSMCLDTPCLFGTCGIQSPCGIYSPCGPVSPCGAFSPCGPVSPCGAFSPCGPFSPCGAMSPCGPGTPCGGFSPCGFSIDVEFPEYELEDLRVLKEQLKQMLEKIEAQEEIVAERDRPQTVEEIDALEEKLKAALEELNARRDELGGRAK